MEELWLYSRNKDDKCSSYLRGEKLIFKHLALLSYMSTSWKYFSNSKSFFFSSPQVLTLHSFLQFWSSVRISLTTKCLAKIMPFPETPFCYLWNLDSLILWRKHITMADKVQTKAEDARDSWIQKCRMTL